MKTVSKNARPNQTSFFSKVDDIKIKRKASLFLILMSHIGVCYSAMDFYNFLSNL